MGESARDYGAGRVRGPIGGEAVARTMPQAGAAVVYYRRWWRSKPLWWRIWQRLWWQAATVWAGLTGGMTPGERWLMTVIAVRAERGGEVLDG